MVLRKWLINSIWKGEPQSWVAYVLLDNNRQVYMYVCVWQSTVFRAIFCMLKETEDANCIVLLVTLKEGCFD